MKTLLLIIALMVFLGYLASAVVLVSMHITSRKLWEYRNELEEENKELLKKIN